MISVEGNICIKLYPDKGKNERVEIESNRPVHAAKVLIGKTPEQVLSVVPLLFSVCGVAQSRASLSAIQQAMQRETDQSPERARDLLVLSESAREHLLRIIIDWPRLFGLQSNNQQLTYPGKLVAKFKRSLFQQADAFSLGSQLKVDFSIVNYLINEFETYLQDYVFCRPTEHWLGIDSIDQLREWSENADCSAAHSVHQICEHGWTSQGNSSCQPLPILDDSSLLRKMNSSVASAFIAQPTWQGNCHQTNSLSRQIKHPLIRLLHQEFDNCLITRWTARLVELALIPQQMRDLLQSIKQQTNGSVTNASVQGLAQVEAARGRLIHQVSIEQADSKSLKISNYQILAPTEWNFHPQGLITQSLKNIKANNKQEHDQLARIMINAIDPCVAYQLSIH